MNELELMSYISDNNFMLHIIDNLPEEYEALLTDVENRLMVESGYKLIIELMHQKLNNFFKRLENKREEDTEEEKVLSAIKKDPIKRDAT